MTISKDSERMRFSSTLRKDLYEQLQKQSFDSDVPISKLLDQSVEMFFDKKKVAIDSDLYSYLAVFFGTKGLDVDDQIENILINFVDNQKKFVEEMVAKFKENQKT